MKTVSFLSLFFIIYYLSFKKETLFDYFSGIIGLIFIKKTLVSFKYYFVTNMEVKMKYELIKYNDSLPFKVIISNAKSKQYHWHKEMEIIFLLKGTVIFEVKGEKHKITEQDLFWVNSLDIHSISSEEDENIMLILQLDPIFFDQYCTDFSTFNYEYRDQINDRNNPIYDKFTTNLAEIMISIIKLDIGYKLKAINSILEIALILLHNFRTEKQQQSNNELYKQQRLSEILKFIEENYNTDLTLDSLSKEIHISPQYISKFFKNNVGIGFVDYVNKLRITKSLNDLLGNNKNIIDIAIEHGFNDHKAYNRVFKKEFQMTATEYRNKSSKLLLNTETSNHWYYDDNSSNYFKYLFDFLQTDKTIVKSSSMPSHKLNININLINHIEKPFIKYWNKITSIGRAALCLRHEVRKQIKSAQTDMGYEFIRFHGIFSDEMMVYKEDSQGNPIYNWIYIDEILDFFYKINLKPFIELGFMPECLANKKQYTPFLWKSNVSYPKSLSKWNDLVSNFIQHCIKRYGRDEVEKWYFQIWNAPDITNVFWFESRHKFFEFYKETYFTIKRISNNIKVVSSGILPTNNFEWFDEFLNYCKLNSIVLDFVACNVYASTDPQNQNIPAQLFKIPNSTSTLSNENFLKNSIDLMREVLKKHSLTDINLFVTEWNLSPYTKDYNRDTCFLSTYIVYNILNNIGNIDNMAFWTLSDILEEGVTEDKLYHGGLGLFTYNGLKKPSYNAFFLLNKLGNNVIEAGKDYIITSNGSNFQILIYNFVYFDDLFVNGDKSLLSYHERYNIFKTTNENKDVNLILSLKKGDYNVKRIKLNRESGSTFDAWIKMGSPEEIQSDVYSYLKAKEILEINVATETVEEQLLLTDSIPPHGILFIEIDKLI